MARCCRIAAVLTTVALRYPCLKARMAVLVEALAQIDDDGTKTGQRSGPDTAAQGGEPLTPKLAEADGLGPLGTGAGIPTKRASQNRVRAADAAPSRSEVREA